jgi:PAS domain-containing protein
VAPSGALGAGALGQSGARRASPQGTRLEASSVKFEGLLNKAKSMLQFLREHRELFEILGIFLTLIAAIVAFYLKVVRTTVCKLCEAVERVYLLPSRIEYIFHELRENSGKSIKDTLKRVEETQLLIVNKHRIILDDHNFGVIETDAEGNITWANQTYLQIVNADLRDVLGNGWINSICPKERDKVFKAWHTAIAQKRAFNYRFNFVVNNTEIPVLAVAYPIAANEAIKGYVGKFKLMVEVK